ncbi:precorrin-2 C(20)-methyltransferase [Dethiothermospora halolimnae]|uniref:precorrin-2 C(20)-methyltransferase n=1 Tax=Dethiothermospora halolimnae TaxID=3114390 RepID=UPI003CCBCA5C
MKGKFYGIGVGPGDPELITIKAVNTLKKVDMVICPEAKKEKGSIAFNIGKNYLKEDMEILYLTFPMTHDDKVLEKKWKENSKIILKHLNKGKHIAFLTIGDPMVYSTYMYLLPYLKEENVDIETIPGITSFCAVASRTNTPLASKGETLCILPLMKDSKKLDTVLDECDNIVVMKPSHDSKLLAKKLVEKGYQDNFILVSKCGTEEEEIITDIERLKNDKIHYLSTSIIKNK